MSAFTEVPDGKEWLTGLLRQGPVTVKFKKVDGTERTMKCTLSEDLILPYPVSESKREKKQNDEVLAVYDLEKESWRSFRLDNIISVEFGL
jgi:hypothetical protein